MAFTPRKLTVDEKVHIMSGNATWLSEAFGLLRRGKKRVYNYRPYLAGGVPRLDIPAIAFVDGPRGVVCGHSTCFPVAMARGASWDVALEEEVGEAIGREVRAHGGNFFGGVCINLLRHPAWGRAQETYGEDPVLLGAMGGALTRGVQRHNVIACVKHFALNSMENMRFEVDVAVDERTLREVYLPHFKECVVEHGALAVMSAYNKVRGTYCGEHRELLTRILRDEWGFTGFVISDFIWGTRDAVRSVKAGLDVEMHIQRTFAKLSRAVKRGAIDEAALDRSVDRIVSTLRRVVDAKDPQRYPQSLIASAEHRALARRSAESSMVLLKNEGATLPFPKGDICRLAVIGALARRSNLGDHGSSLVRPPSKSSPFGGLRKYLAGQGEVVHDDGRSIEQACALAQSCDAAVLVVGNGPLDEGEYVLNVPFADHSFFKKRGISFGGDRDDLGLRAHEQELIEAVSKVQSRLCVVVIGGSAVLMEPWREQVPAIMMGWYAGMEGGAALGRVLFGEVSPSGKLPFTIAKRAEDYVPFDKRANEAKYGYFHGYTWADHMGIAPAFAFGHGLSYTRFEYRDLRVASEQLEPDGVLSCTVTVANVGQVEAQEVVQLYFGSSASSILRPKKKLLAFRKVNIPAGESRDISFEIPVSKLAYYDDEARRWRVEPTTYELQAGGASDALPLMRQCVVG